MVNTEPKLSEVTVAAATVRCVRIRGGMVPLSLKHNWQIAKAISSDNPSARDIITRVLSQVYLLLPHCNANSNSIKPSTRNAVPTGSNCMTRCLKDSLTCFLSGGFDGRISSSTTMATPPTGILIQKHQRQVTFDAKKPPSKGPATEARPKLAAIAPWYFG